MPLGSASARLLSSSPRYVLKRAMSMWPKNYEDPVEHKSMIRFGNPFSSLFDFKVIFNHRDLREKGDFERKKIMPIKGHEAMIGRVFGLLLKKYN